MLTDIVKKLRLDFQNLTSERDFENIIRFVYKNFELEENEFVAKFEKERFEREEAYKKELHRQENVVDQVDGISLEKQKEIFLKLQSTFSKVSTSDTSNEVN